MTIHVIHHRVETMRNVMTDNADVSRNSLEIHTLDVALNVCRVLNVPVIKLASETNV